MREWEECPKSVRPPPAELRTRAYEGPNPDDLVNAYYMPEANPRDMPAPATGLQRFFPSGGHSCALLCLCVSAGAVNFKPSPFRGVSIMRTC